MLILQLKAYGNFLFIFKTIYSLHVLWSEAKYDFSFEKFIKIYFKASTWFSFVKIPCVHEKFYIFNILFIIFVHWVSFTYLIVQILNLYNFVCFFYQINGNMKMPTA